MTMKPNANNAKQFVKPVTLDQVVRPVRGKCLTENQDPVNVQLDTTIKVLYPKMFAPNVRTGIKYAQRKIPLLSVMV